MPGTMNTVCGVDPIGQSSLPGSPRSPGLAPHRVKAGNRLLRFVLAERFDRRTQDVVSLLKAVGTRLPVSELERFRSSVAE